MASPSEPFARPGPILAQVAFVVLAALVVYGFVAVSKEGETRRVCSAPCLMRPDYMSADRRAPGFSLKDMNGDAVTLDSLHGKVVVLNFWTKTCGPCLEEMPDLAELTKIVRDRPDVAVVAVSVDEGPDDVRPTLQTVRSEDVRSLPRGDARPGRADQDRSRPARRGGRGRLGGRGARRRAAHAADRPI